VQGVGFRPFVYRLAVELGLSGWVRNTPDGVHIEAEGTPEALKAFLRRLPREVPPLARVQDLSWEETAPRGEQGFHIVSSAGASRARPAVPPDVATCDSCRGELRDPGDRRYRYPFINCTDCGPRFTIIEAMPYDRSRTTMKRFPMCSLCAEECSKPADRRFHAQPNACPRCGPRVWAAKPDGTELPGRWEEHFHRAIAAGGVVAVKGLGGFHLACDARDERAVAKLRGRKRRPAKPLAVMFRDLQAVRRYCVIADEEAGLLQSARAPIVLLRRKPGSCLAPGIAPGLRTVGAMLPYTPLHLLLFEGGCDALVMTSGNPRGLPLCIDNHQALRELGGLADLFLLHDRPIKNRCDDSVLRLTSRGSLFYRRSRGWVPEPITVPSPRDAPPVVGVGGDLKNTFCILQEGEAVLSQHLGDLDYLEAQEAWRDAFHGFCQLFRFRPAVCAHDPHPGYASRRLAESLGLRCVPVQHHHAHVASCWAEWGLEGPAVGVAADGTGYGADGRIWGFEFLVGDYREVKRFGHLAYLPLPGGEGAIRRPLVLAGACLGHFLGEDAVRCLAEVYPRVARQIWWGYRMLKEDLRIVWASSLGRLFDCVSAMVGVCWESTYEGQAAAELGELAEEGGDPYPIRVDHGVIDPSPMLAAILADVRAGRDPREVSARFHSTVAHATLRLLRSARAAGWPGVVALSGGCYQNPRLLEETAALLEGDGWEVLTPRRVPPNDGGLSLGQAVVASWRCASCV